VRRSFTVVLLTTLMGIAACGKQEPSPSVHTITPTSILPGGLVLISGSGFRQDDAVLINGRPAARVTWVNPSLLAALVPQELGAGAHGVAVVPASGQQPGGDEAVRQPLLIHTPPPTVVRPPPDPAATRPRVTVTVPPRASGDDDEDDDD
jgi:hypothetical protein